MQTRSLIRRMLPVAALLVSIMLPARAEVPGTVTLGILNDMSGPYSDNGGKGSVEAAQMAADEFMAAHPGAKVSIVKADHQNKPDVGSSIARQWVSGGTVNAIVDVPNSAVALAVNDVLRGSAVAFVASSSATSRLTGKDCSPNTVQWTYDTWAVSRTLAEGLAAKDRRNWYIIATDNALGKSLVTDTGSALATLGGVLTGSSYAPINTSEYSSELLQASSSGADVIAFATAGSDTVALMKQATEFGLRNPGKQFAALLATVNDVRAASLGESRGDLMVQPFYADLNSSSRAWAEKFAARYHGEVPTAFHAGVYSSVRAYLQAAAEAGTVVKRMKQDRFHDDAFGDVVVRPDGRAVHAMYVFRVKAPAQSKGPGDLLELQGTVGGDQAFRPIADGGCPLLNRM